jgi:hypothetical protein
MPDLVTIWAFQYQHQLLIVRGRLEAEGIETYVQDELTIQVDPFYSNALGGIKLMVHQADVPRATEILAESGLVKQNEKQPFEFLHAFSDTTHRLPWIGHLKFENRVFILVTLFVLFTAGILYLLAG